MFGGVECLVHGHLAVAASGRGGLTPRVELDADATGTELRQGVELGTGYAPSLPPRQA